MEAFITDLFMKCVYMGANGSFQVMGGAPGEYGYGYYLANNSRFITVKCVYILQPGLLSSSFSCFG